MPEPVVRSRRWAAYLALALAGVAFSTVLALRSPTAWNVDFNEFYSAGKLVGTGHLYDWDAIQGLELPHGTKAVPFGRIPAMAVAFYPLSAMPYEAARVLWLAIGMAALAGFVLLWPLVRRGPIAAAICWSVPALMCLAFGQDSVLFLFFVALGIWLLEEHEFWAGVVLSACIAKPHLALLLPVFLAGRGKWKAVLGGAAGGALSLLVSFAVEGKDWPARLMTLARAPEFNPAADRMPTLTGLLSLTGGGLAVQIAVSVAVVAACWFLSSRLSLVAAAALALAGSLLLSPHAYGYDAVLLLPALAWSLEASDPPVLRAWAMLLVTPLPYLLLLSRTELPGHLAITGYTLTLFAAEIIRIRRTSPAVIRAAAEAQR